MNFNGTDESIVVNNSSVTQFPRNEPYSVSFWINASTYVLNAKGLMGNGNFANAVYAKTGYGSGVWSIEWYMAGRAGWGDQLVVSTGNTLLANTWYHVCVTYSGNALASGLKMYIDYSNVYNGTGALNYSDPVTNNNDWYIARNGPSGIHFPGKIDEVAIWNKALSATEVAALATANAPANLMALSAKPIAYWPLGEFAGNSGELGGTPSGQTNSWKFPNQVLKDYVFTSGVTGNVGKRFNIVGLPEFTGSKTVSIWFKTNYASYSPLISPDLSHSGYPLLASGTSVWLRKDYSTYSTGITFDYSVTDGKWHNITVAGEGQGGTAKIYLDGIVQTKSDGVTEDIDDFDCDLNYILGNLTNSSYVFKGQISNVAFWRGVKLTSSQVLSLYNNGSPSDLNTFTPSATNWYKLNSESVYKNTSANISSALEFSGSASSRIDLSSTITATSNQPKTISFWCKPIVQSASGSDMDFILGDGISWFIMLNKNTLVSRGPYANYSITKGFSFADTVSYADTVDPEWSHIVFTTDASGNSKSYLNGEFVRAGNNTVPQFKISTIGSNNSNYHFKGYLSNLAFWNETQLTDEQVKIIYNNGTPQTNLSYSPTNWWRLNNTSNSSSSDGLYDLGSGSVSGTAVGVSAVTDNVAVEGWRINDSKNNNGNIIQGVGLTRSDLIPSDLQFESPYSNFSLDFDGTNWLDLNSNLNSLGVSTSFSVSFWVNISNNVLYDNIISAPTSIDVWDSGFGVYLTGNALIFWVEDWNDSNHFATSATLNNDQWYHVCCTFSTSNGLKLYIDAGTPTTASNTDIDGLTNNIYIGSSGNAATRALNGKIDEVAIWNSELTASQVNQVYNNGRPGDLTSLSPISWSRLGEDAFFVNNNITIPNQISGGPTGTGSGTQTAMLSADAPQSYGGGYGVGLAVTDKIGDAPNSTANSLSYNMIPDNRHPYIPGYAPAKVDNDFSMSFNGSDQYLNCGTISALNGGITAFSTSIWINYSGSLAADMLLSGGTSTADDFYIQLTSSTNLRYASGAQFDDITISSISAGTWYHIATVHSGTSVDVYLDGTLQGNATTQAPTDNIGTNLIIGDYLLTGSGFNYEGKLDEVAIFDYALTAKQIKEDIYNASTTGKTADLSNNSNLTAPVAWYRMGD